MVWSTVKFCSPLTDFQPVLFIYMLGQISIFAIRHLMIQNIMFMLAVR